MKKKLANIKESFAISADTGIKPEQLEAFRKMKENERYGIKLTQRILADSSLGQHHHVFFHKSRYSYASPITGFLSILIYMSILYYACIRFYTVFSPTNFDTPLILYKPLNFTEDTSLTIGKFFQSAQMHVYFQIGFDSWSWNCSTYSGK
jgi:hypothetical protein